MARYLRPGSSGGFTLLEIVVALAVLAIAMAAVLESSGASARHQAHLRDRTFSHWVAANRVVELQLVDDWPAEGVSEGNAELGGWVWRWTARVSETPDDAVRRVDVEVRKDPGDAEALSSLFAYLGRP